MIMSDDPCDTHVLLHTTQSQECAPTRPCSAQRWRTGRNLTQTGGQQSSGDLSAVQHSLSLVGVPRKPPSEKELSDVSVLSKFPDMVHCEAACTSATAGTLREGKVTWTDSVGTGAQRNTHRAMAEAHAQTLTHNLVSGKAGCSVTLPWPCHLVRYRDVISSVVSSVRNKVQP